MVSVLRIAALCVIAFAVGCGEGSTPVEDPGISVQEQIEQDLQMIADNGEVGSEVIRIEQNLGELAESEPAKAEELSQDLEELKGQSGAQATRKAEEMIGKL